MISQQASDLAVSRAYAVIALLDAQDEYQAGELKLPQFSSA